MDLMTLIEWLETPADEAGRWDDLYPYDEVLAAIGEHRDALRKLNGQYGRMITALENRGSI
jgi:hypothetical protein